MPYQVIYILMYCNASSSFSLNVNLLRVNLNMKASNSGSMATTCYAAK